MIKYERINKQIQLFNASQRNFASQGMKWINLNTVENNSEYYCFNLISFSALI